MDVLHPQVHDRLGRPLDLPGSVPLLLGDVSHAPDWEAVLRLVRPRQVVHLAAETGTAQSLSEATRHAAVNVLGTAQMLDALTRADLVPDQMVLASSRAVYGEGAWRSGDRVFYPGPRTHEQLAAAIWNPVGPDGEPAVPVPNSASTTEPHPTSVYGATKLAQEHMMAAWTSARGNALSIVRLQNVYGPGQSLSNPYTGIVSLFAQLALAGCPLEVYEDGEIVRDFVYIEDVVDAFVAVIESGSSRRRILDVGSGNATTVYDLARHIVALCGAPEPTVVGKFRDGDVRAATCDIVSTVTELPWRPKWSLRSGLEALITWIEHHPRLSPPQAG